MLLLYQFLHPRILRIQTVELHCGDKLVRFFAMAQFLALVILLIEILLQFQIALQIFWTKMYTIQRLSVIM